MSTRTMSSLQRVLTTLGHQEPDRVPLFLLLSLHGARFAGLSIEDYFAAADAVVAAQLAMRERYRNDCLYTFQYAALEVEPFGGSTLFYPDGPPNAGTPPLHEAAAIDTLRAPDIGAEPKLQRLLEVTRRLHAEVGDQAPIIGVVIAPFSLPVMQLGFEGYLNLLYTDERRFQRLMTINSAFCVAWANAQLAAGATAICYFNPLASVSMLPRDHYLKYGYPVDLATLAAIEGPTATHLASGHALGLVGDIAASGSAVLGVSTEESLAELKAAARGKITLLGNLNGIAMRNWDAAEAERQVKAAIAAAGPGGGFILADNHGEIPWQVEDATLLAIAEAVARWGRYPLSWVGEDG